MRVDVDVPAMDAEETPVLVADVVQPSALGGATPVVLGPVGAGRRTLEAGLPCPAKTCRLAGVELRRPGSAFFAYRGTVVLAGLQVHGRRAGTTSRARSRPQPAGGRVLPGAASATSGPDGTTLAVRAAVADGPTWQVADHPAALPALVGAGVAEEGRTSSAGLGLRPLPLDPSRWRPRSPRAATAARWSTARAPCGPRRAGSPARSRPSGSPRRSRPRAAAARRRRRHRPRHELGRTRSRQVYGRQGPLGPAAVPRRRDAGRPARRRPGPR